MIKQKDTTPILQIGQLDWSKNYQIPEDLNWVHILPGQLEQFLVARRAQQEAYDTEQAYLRRLKEQKATAIPKPSHQPPMTYKGILLPDDTYPDQILELLDLAEPYQIFYHQSHEHLERGMRELLRQRLGQPADLSQPQAFIDLLKQVLFDGQYGAKMPVSDLTVTPHFQGQVSYDGHSYLEMDGDYGQTFRQIAHFNYNIAHYAGLAQNLFFEHLCDPGVETRLVVQLIPSGSLGDIIKEWVVDGNQTKEQLVISHPVDGYLAVSMQAKGQGKLRLGPCHYRYGRHQFGEFLLGGQRFVDDEQQEFMSYFHPQDFKPPLCVYFSGFRTAEGFEGYWMMKSLGAPFLLICDPRMDGGSFYMGSPAFEEAVSAVIQEKLDFLGFDRSQLVLSGLSMGTFGATYHGAKLAPHAIILGKPVFSLGEVALREKIQRPAGFPTSLDLLKRFAGSVDELGAARLDERFWQAFEAGDFSATNFAIAYMKDDDYDRSAFSKVLEKTRGSSTTVIGRGWAGRHGDGGSGPTNWFFKQLMTVLKTDFGREF